MPPVADCSQTVQCILDRASVSISVNNAFIDMTVPQVVSVGTSYAITVTRTTPNAQPLFTSFWYVRDDGRERVPNCTGGGISTVGGGISGMSATITPVDPILTPGYTVRIYLVGTFGPPPEGCPLWSATGVLSQAAVQGQRHLATFVVQ